jgi:hypothetical protein
MELNDLKPIAENLFLIMPQEDFLSKDASDIEGAVQLVANQLASVLMQDFVLPARVSQIQAQVAEGSLLCQDCKHQLQLHKQDQPIHLKTIFGNAITLSRHQYSCPTCHAYPSPADAQLGLIGRQMTPRLALVVALCGASWSYSVASAFLDFLLGVEVSAKTVELVSADERVKQEALPVEPLDQPPGVTGCDGVLIRGRQKGQWLEMKVGCFFSNILPTSESRSEVLDASFVASEVERWKEFVPIVTEEAFRRGLDCTEEIEFVGDGAEGIWSLQEMVFPYAKTRLDLYHAKKKISHRTGQAYKNNPAKEKHRAALTSYLGSGEVAEAVSYISKHNPRKGWKKEAARKLINYLKRHQSHIPNYEQIKGAGGTVSSGLIEKGNDLVVVRRMKDRQMHWSREGAGPVIKHRTRFINRGSKTRTGPYDLAFCRQAVQ